jgi:hypothetical protein
LRLDEIAASDKNLNASVAAIKTAEMIGDERAASGQCPQVPGLVVQIINAPAAPLPRATIEAIPLPTALPAPPDAAVEPAVDELAGAPDCTPVRGRAPAIASLLPEWRPRRRRGSSTTTPTKKWRTFPRFALDLSVLLPQSHPYPQTSLRA